MRKRTKARELALQFLYSLDLRKFEGMDNLGEFLKEQTQDEEVTIYTKRLIEGVSTQRAVIDRRIQEIAKNWSLKRMAAIDRSILRMGAYELLHCQDIPAKVAINEAIELGKKFSTENSGSFINGILDKIRVETEKAK